MTGLLVSVRNVAEAREALAGGADIIDIKEPARGPLGAAEPAVWREIMAEIGATTVVSAALGELHADPLERLAPQAAGLSFVKIGLAGCGADRAWKRRWSQVICNLSPSVLTVPVAYADWRSIKAPPPEDVLALAAQQPARMLLMDTHDKRGATLRDVFPWSQLERFALAAAQSKVRLALAGSLTLNDIRRLKPLQPDYLGVRGAACTGGRDGMIQRALVKSLADALRARTPLPAV